MKASILAYLAYGMDYRINIFGVACGADELVY